MLINWPFSKRYRIRCPDGSIKILYRHVDDAFPLFIPGWKGDINAEVKAFEQLPANVRASYESSIHGLLYSLDDRNQSLILTFRGVYVLYMSDPCSYSEFFKRQIEKLLDEQRTLSNLRIRIQGLVELLKVRPQADDQVLTVFGDIVQEIGGRAVPEAAKREIAASRDLMTKWIGGTENDS